MTKGNQGSSFSVSRNRIPQALPLLLLLAACACSSAPCFVACCFACFALYVFPFEIRKWLQMGHNGSEKRERGRKRRVIALTLSDRVSVWSWNLKFDRRRGLSPLHVGLATCDIIIRSSSRINCVEPVSWVLSDQRKRWLGGGGGGKGKKKGNKQRK